ncbi:MAG: HAD family hydrolase [Bacillota bacterium]|nr:HAD family hydrolase [Bacillota bacterium]
MNTPAVPRYRLVVVDLDDTLLDSSRRVHPEVHAVVAKAGAIGVRFSVATGRVFSSAAQVAAELGIDVPIISDGGAVLRHPSGQPSLRDLRIAPLVAAAILAATAGEDVDHHVFYPDEILVNRASPAVARYATRLRVEMRPVEDLSAEARRREIGPTMIVLRGTAETAPAMRARYQARFGGLVQVTSTAPHFVDFVHHDTSKSSALGQLGRYLGIGPAETIAVGDGVNDLDMLAYAGLGALVANADPGLWQYADYVAKKPHHRGVVEVIDRFCLGPHEPT